MTWYFVDLENIGYDIVDFIRNEHPRNSKFIMYYTAKMNFTSTDFWVTMMDFVQMGYHIEFIKAVFGPQAADKMILVDVAMNVMKNKNRKYVIITKDKGYDQPLDQIRDFSGVHVYRSSKLSSLAQGENFNYLEDE